MCKMHLISAEGYKNAKVDIKIVRETGEIWVSMKDVGNGIDVKNIFDLVLKDIYGFVKQKILQRRKLKNIKLLKDKFFKNLII